jgi:hypothetical protein
MEHPVDDWLSLAALGVLAFALTDVSHEALGHGLATLAVGGKAVLLTTCNFNSSGKYSRWIPAAGGLMNLAVGLGSLATLRLISPLGPLLRYFLVLVAAFNLFFAFGYPAYSGIARFGDWAAVWARTALAMAGSAGGCCRCRLLRKHEAASESACPLCRGCGTANSCGARQCPTRANHAHSLCRSDDPGVSGGGIKSRRLADHAHIRAPRCCRCNWPHTDGSLYRSSMEERFPGNRRARAEKSTVGDGCRCRSPSSLSECWAPESGFPNCS